MHKQSWRLSKIDFNAMSNVILCLNKIYFCLKSEIYLKTTLILKTCIAAFYLQETKSFFFLCVLLCFGFFFFFFIQCMLTTKDPQLLTLKPGNEYFYLLRSYIQWTFIFKKFFVSLFLKIYCTSIHILFREVSLAFWLMC